MYMIASKTRHGGLRVGSVRILPAEGDLHQWILRRITLTAYESFLLVMLEAVSRALELGSDAIPSGDVGKILSLAGLWHSSGIWWLEPGDGDPPEKLSQRDTAQKIVEALASAGLEPDKVDLQTLVALRDAAVEAHLRLGEGEVTCTSPQTEAPTAGYM